MIDSFQINEPLQLRHLKYFRLIAYSCLIVIGFSIGFYVGRLTTPTAGIPNAQLTQTFVQTNAPIFPSPTPISKKRLVKHQNNKVYSLITQDTDTHLYELVNGVAQESALETFLPLTSYLEGITDFWYVPAERKLFIVQHTGPSGQGALEKLSSYTLGENPTEQVWFLHNFYKHGSHEVIVDYDSNSNSLLLITHHGDGPESYKEIWWFNGITKRQVIDTVFCCEKPGTFYIGYADGLLILGELNSYDPETGVAKSTSLYSLDPITKIKKLLDSEAPPHLMNPALDTENPEVINANGLKYNYRTKSTVSE